MGERSRSMRPGPAKNALRAEAVTAVAETEADAADTKPDRAERPDNIAGSPFRLRAPRVVSFPGAASAPPSTRSANFTSGRGRSTPQKGSRCDSFALCSNPALSQAGARLLAAHRGRERTGRGSAFPLIARQQRPNDVRALLPDPNGSPRIA